MCTESIRKFVRWLCGGFYSKPQNGVVNDAVEEEGLTILETKKEDEEVEKGVEMLEIIKDSESMEEEVEGLDIKKNDDLPEIVVQAEAEAIPSTSSAARAAEQGQLIKKNEAADKYKPGHYRYGAVNETPYSESRSTVGAQNMYRRIGDGHGRRPTILVLGLMHSRLINGLSKIETGETTPNE